LHPTPSRTLLLVHPHPDDESLATGGVILRAKSERCRVVLVTCTSGEEGEVHNLDEAAVRPRLGQVRRRELARACRLLGIDRLELLGYRDSGMAGSGANHHPASFLGAPLEEAAGRLAAVLSEERPAVVVADGPGGTYGHPDHLKAHRVTVAALDVLERRGWRPVKTYWHSLPRSRVERLAERLRRTRPGAGGGETPFVGVPDPEITTTVDVRDVAPRKLAAFSAHVSQHDRRAPLASLAGQMLEALLGYEHFVLARGELEGPPPERSLFAGIAQTGWRGGSG
jgi:LmbE family N-acetylglucosaminyl deacetylase